MDGSGNSSLGFVQTNRITGLGYVSCITDAQNCHLGWSNQDTVFLRKHLCGCRIVSLQLVDVAFSLASSRKRCVICTWDSKGYLFSSLPETAPPFRVQKYFVRGSFLVKGDVRVWPNTPRYSTRLLGLFPVRMCAAGSSPLSALFYACWRNDQVHCWHGLQTLLCLLKGMGVFSFWWRGMSSAILFLFCVAIFHKPVISLQVLLSSVNELVKYSEFLCMWRVRILFFSHKQHAIYCAKKRSQWKGKFLMFFPDNCAKRWFFWKSWKMNKWSI